MAGLSTSYEGARGPRVRNKRAPGKSSNMRSWCVAQFNIVQKKKVAKGVTKKLWQKRILRLWQKKN